MNKEKMRESTLSASNIWLSLIQEKNRNSETARLFCFYEGEDSKYYNRRIKTIFTEVDLIQFDCQGKNNVLKIYEKIKNEEDSLQEYLFFVDKDYSTKSPYPDVYQTPLYSIENFYTDPRSVKNILTDKFNLHPTEVDDFSQRYEDLYNQYLELYNNVTVWYLACCDEGIPIEINKTYRVDSHISIENNSIILKKDYITTLSTVGRCIESRLSPEELRKYKELYSSILQKAEHIIKDIDPKINSRGKFEFDFLKLFLNYIKKLNDNHLLNYNYSHIKIKHLLNDDPLQSLSEYAITPEDLNTYISNHLPIQ